MRTWLNTKENIMFPTKNKKLTAGDRQMLYTKFMKQLSRREEDEEKESMLAAGFPEELHEKRKRLNKGKFALRRSFRKVKAQES